MSDRPVPETGHKAGDMDSAPLSGAPSGCERPWCCPEPRCRPVHQLKNADLRIPAPGDSFICFGQMPQGIAFDYDGDRHENDLRSCHYTPLKGVVANQENADDWAMVGRAYATALKALRETQAEPVSEKSGDV